MGWASGSTVMTKIIEVVKKEVPSKKKRKALYVGIVDALRDADWDTLDECLGEDQAYDEVYNELYPEDDDDE